MKKGITFQRDGTEYVVALCRATRNGNAAILLRGTGECKCVTVSNLKADGQGIYSWESGIPASNYDDAVVDFMARVTG